MKTLEEIKKKIVTCSICGKKVYASDANKHMHAKEIGWNKTGLRPIKQEMIDFIQDQQSHEVENETILEKIPNLVECLTDKLVSQTKQELIEEIKDFEQKVNQFDMSSGAIDDNNSMLIELIGECRKLLEKLSNK